MKTHSADSSKRIVFYVFYTSQPPLPPPPPLLFPAMANSISVTIDGELNRRIFSWRRRFLTWKSGESLKRCYQTDVEVGWKPETLLPNWRGSRVKAFNVTTKLTWKSGESLKRCYQTDVEFRWKPETLLPNWPGSRVKMLETVDNIGWCVCGAMQDLLWRTFGRLTILLRFWMSICCCWLDVLFQPRSSVCATRISLGLMLNAGMLLASSMRLIFVAQVIALGWPGKSLSTVKWELMKPTRRPSVSLVPETWMFLWMPSLLINGGPLLSLLCSAWVRHCRRLLVEVVDWCENRLAKLIFSRIIFMASSLGSLLICHSFSIRLWVFPLLPSGRVRSGVSC